MKKVAHLIGSSVFSFALFLSHFSFANSPCCNGNRWLIPSLSALTIAVGVGGGYGAGYRKNRTKKVTENRFCTFPTSNEFTSLAWINPSLDAPGNPIVAVELYAPDQTLLANADLQEGMDPPNISFLGNKKDSLEGVYTAVFTAFQDIPLGASGGFLGGVRVNGKNLLSAPFPPNETILMGTQVIVEFPYALNQKRKSSDDCHCH